MAGAAPQSRVPGPGFSTSQGPMGPTRCSFIHSRIEGKSNLGRGNSPCKDVGSTDEGVSSVLLWFGNIPWLSFLALSSCTINIC